MEQVTLFNPKRFEQPKQRSKREPISLSHLVPLVNKVFKERLESLGDHRG